MNRFATVLLVLGVFGCDQQPAAVVPQPVTATAGASGGAAGASGGAAGASGGGSAAANDAGGGEPARREAILLDDFEGGGEIPTLWLANGSQDASVNTTAPVPARAASRDALHVTPASTASGADVFMHHHVDWTQRFAGVRFWVRVDDPAGAEVAVAVTSLVSETHAAALAAGRPWLMAHVTAGPEWKQVTVRFDALAPESAGAAQPTFDPSGVSELHFLAPVAGSGGAWLDDIELLCNDAGC